MKYSETIASKCRYGEILSKIIGEMEILWEESDNNYQGHVKILAKETNLIENNDIYWFYEYYYGSCSGCDDWESRRLTDAQIEREMMINFLVMSKKEFMKWKNGNPVDGALKDIL